MISTGNLAEQVLAHDQNNSEGLSHTFGLAQAAKLAALALAGFVVTCLCLRLLVPKPLWLYAAIRSEKLQLAEQWADKATVVAFGSSHVDQGFDPRVFDATVQAGVRRPTSLNLAVKAGSQLEQISMSEELAGMTARSKSSDRPRLFLFELNLGSNFTPNYLEHPRVINLYDRKNLELALKFADRSLGLERMAGRSAYAVAAAAMNFANTGMLSSRIFSPDINLAIVRHQTDMDRRGLTPGEGTVTAWPTATASQLMLGELTPGHCAGPLRLLSHVTDGTVKILFIVTPKLSDLQIRPSYGPAVACGNVSIPIINVAIPELHPELYELSIWQEDSHLNERGAAVYTRLLAQEVQKVLGAGLQEYFWQGADAVH